MVYDLLGSHPLIVSALIFYCICGLWRLSFYNISEPGKFFSGLPVPGAMMIVTITLWCVYMYGVPLWVAAVMFFVVGTLMLSAIRLPKYGPWQKAMGIAGLGFLFWVILHPWIVG